MNFINFMLYKLYAILQTRKYHRLFQLKQLFYTEISRIA